MKKALLIAGLMAGMLLTGKVAHAEDEDLTIPSYENCRAGTATCQSRTVGGQTIYYAITYHQRKGNSSFSYDYDTMTIFGPTAEGESIDIPDNAFYSNWNSSVPDTVYELNFSGNINSIGSKAFGYAHLHSIVIPDTLTSINSEALWNSITYRISDPFYLYCPSNLSGCSTLRDSYTVQIYDKDQQTGVLTIGENTYGSTLDMQNNVTCSVATGECATKVAQSMIGNGQCNSQQACENLLKMVSDSNYACNTIASCSTYAQNPENNITLASLYGNNTNNSAASNSKSRQSKRIYTVEEAAAVSKETGNTIKLRYK